MVLLGEKFSFYFYSAESNNYLYFAISPDLCEDFLPVNLNIELNPYFGEEISTFSSTEYKIFYIPNKFHKVFFKSPMI